MADKNKRLKDELAMKTGSPDPKQWKGYEICPTSEYDQGENSQDETVSFTGVYFRMNSNSVLYERYGQLLDGQAEDSVRYPH